MKANVYNQEGKEVGTMVLPKEIFGAELKSDLVYQVAVSQMANRRKAVAKAKDRGEVRGGGRKPWRQKGTGRARHGSRRSPLWRGGGVTFGPTKDKVFKKKINKKMKRKALLMVLSEKAKNNLIIVLDKLNLPSSKTKALSQIIRKLPIKEKSCLIILPKTEKNIVVAAKNISRLKVMEAKSLNALDLLSFKCLIMMKEAIQAAKTLK